MESSQTTQPSSAPAPVVAAPSAARGVTSGKPAPRRDDRRTGSGPRTAGGGPSRTGGGARRSGGRPEREVREFEQKTLALDRVTRVTAGGKRMTFRAAILIGDRKGRVGFAVEKGLDVQISMDKAYRQAKKHLVRIPLVNDTIPHAAWAKFGSAVVMLKPAPKGTGLKCGGAVRSVLELAGVPNAVSKIVNSKNKLNIAKATFAAIAQLRLPPPKPVKEGKEAKVSNDKKV